MEIKKKKENNIQWQFAEENKSLDKMVTNESGKDKQLCLYGTVYTHYYL